MPDRVISSIFSMTTPMVSKQYTISTSEKLFKNGGHFEFLNFCQVILLLAKMVAIFHFQNLAKNAKANYFEDDSFIAIS